MRASEKKTFLKRRSREEIFESDRRKAKLQRRKFKVVQFASACINQQRVKAYEEHRKRAQEAKHSRKFKDQLDAIVRLALAPWTEGAELQNEASSSDSPAEDDGDEMWEDEPMLQAGEEPMEIDYPMLRGEQLFEASETS